MVRNMLGGLFQNADTSRIKLLAQARKRCLLQNMVFMVKLHLMYFIIILFYFLGFFLHILLIRDQLSPYSSILY